MIPIHFLLIVGLLAGITGWNHRDPETKAMCRFAGAVCAIVAAAIWGPTVIRWVLS